MRLMGIDFGSKKLGIALSDPAQTMAFPREVIPNDSVLLERLGELIEVNQVEAVVLGDSRDYSGAQNPIAAEAHTFAELIKNKYSLPVHFESEILTTKEAERLQGSNELTDASAAALILQSFIDRKRTNHG